jgi:hypothetical protein
VIFTDTVAEDNNKSYVLLYEIAPNEACAEKDSYPSIDEHMMREE